MVKKRPTTIPARFYAQAETFPDTPAVIFPEVVFSYAQLRDLIAAFSIRFKQAGVDQSSTLRVCSNDLAVVLPTALAAALVGARLVEGQLTDSPTVALTHVIVDTPTTSEHTQILVDASFSPALFSVEEKAAMWKLLDQIVPDTIWMVAAASGVDPAKNSMVGLSQSLLVNRSDACGDDIQSGQTKIASLWPETSYAFLNRALTALMQGATIVDKASWEFWVDVGVHVISGSVKHARVFKSLNEENTKIPKFEASGGLLSTTDITELQGSFGEIENVVECPEIGLVYSTIQKLSAENEQTQSARELDATIEVVDESGNPVAPETLGQLRARSAHNSASVDAVRADGWFYPGYIAKADSSGRVFLLCQASDDLISVGGEHILASFIDCVLNFDDGVVEAVAFSSPKSGTDDIIAFAVFEDGINRFQVTESAKRDCQIRFGQAFAPTNIWPINEVPRKLNGLPDRNACAEMVLKASK